VVRLARLLSARAAKDTIAEAAAQAKAEG